MSARHLTRLFRQELGMTPGQWVEAARITAARALLEAGRLAPKQAAAACGFANADSFRRAFQRVLGVSPAQYRRMHGRAPAPVDGSAM
jgi:transcriptional regulator GlxA family with amidase domain